MAQSVTLTTGESCGMKVLRSSGYGERALVIVLLGGGAVVAAVGRTVKPRVAAGDAATAEAGAPDKLGFISATRSGICRDTLQLPITMLVGWCTSN